MKLKPATGTNKVIRCPSCQHGIDPHGVNPGSSCGVGDSKGNMCVCLWSPNDIAAWWIGKYNLDDARD